MIPYLDHLFIATSATCVTGLVPIVVAEQYTYLVQLVILALIQNRWVRFFNPFKYDACCF